MEKRLIASALTVLMVLSIMSGCASSRNISAGSSAPASSGGESSAIASQQQSEPESDEPVHLQAMITSLNDSADGPFLLGVMEEFEASHPNVTIEPIPVAMNDLYTKLLTLATSGDSPDIVTIGSIL